VALAAVALVDSVAVSVEVAVGFVVACFAVAADSAEDVAGFAAVLVVVVDSVAVFVDFDTALIVVV